MKLYDLTIRDRKTNKILIHKLFTSLHLLNSYYQMLDVDVLRQSTKIRAIIRRGEKI